MTELASLYCLKWLCSITLSFMAPIWELRLRNNKRITSFFADNNLSSIFQPSLMRMRMTHVALNSSVIEINLNYSNIPPFDISERIFRLLGKLFILRMGILTGARHVAILQSFIIFYEFLVV